MPSLNLTSNNNTANYSLVHFAFGEVYFDAVPESAYFQSLTNNTIYGAIFDTVFQGLGLPGDVWTTFYPLLQYIVGDTATCDSTSSDGICVLSNGTCASYT